MKAILIFVLMLSTVIVRPPDVSGEWEGSLKWGAGSTLSWYMRLTQDGEKLYGTMGPAKESDQRDIQDGKIEGNVLRFRVPGGDGSGKEFLTVELQLQNDELIGTMKGKDESGQMETYAVSMKRAKTQ